MHFGPVEQVQLFCCVRWQDTILEGSRPLPLTPEEATSLLAQLPDLAIELQLARSLLHLHLFRNADFERQVARLYERTVVLRSPGLGGIYYKFLNQTSKIGVRNSIVLVTGTVTAVKFHFPN